MARRIVVSPSCAKRCPSCFVCDAHQRPLTLQQALAVEPEAPDLPVLLGGGDATKWAHLNDFLAVNRARPHPHKVWVEAPAASFTPEVLKDLASRGVEGVRVQIEALGEKMIRAMQVGDGEKAIADAEAAGLQADARICARPKTLPIISPLARRLSPRTVWLEVYRQNWGEAPIALPVETLDPALAPLTNVQFSAHRASADGYAPPCVMPASWRSHHKTWQSTFSERTIPNDALPICHGCILNTRCQWHDPNALSDAAKAAARPILKEPPVRRIVETPVPEIIVKRRRFPDVVCTEPWTTIEMAGHDGNVHQCGGNWTSRLMGNIHDNTLTEIWNGQPYQEARRLMGQATVSDLCKPICTRLYDGVLDEKKFVIQAGSEAFVRNQLLLAEEIAERKEVLTALPRHMTLCPSSYCNYNCVFCDHGRKPRWDMPDRVWDELPLFLPALKTLTLLGGEPFANSRVWEFLTTFDTEKYPDVRLDIFTNGALMTEKALAKVRSSSLGEITISLNAGLPDVYDAVERGSATLEKVVSNVDALMRLRDSYEWWFGITLSLIVMKENAHTLIPFGQLALERNLHIRLVGLLIRRPEDEPYNFYKNPDEVAHVIRELDKFIVWARHVGRPDYVQQAQASRDAVIGEAGTGGETTKIRSWLVPLSVPRQGTTPSAAP
jgi:MoaA/NifB/PqqE/SkfB family radical SAM enzyme